MTQFIDLGIMVGSSADGADIVAAYFSEKGCDVQAHFHWAFDLKMQYRLKSAAMKVQYPYELVKEEYIQLEDDLTKEIIKAVKNYDIFNRYPIAQISYHGFTLFHHPGLKLSWQLGDLLKLSKELKCPIVGDFRQSIIDNGGKGAPLIPLFHHWLIEKKNESKGLFLNLGGISNISVITEKEVWGSDVGPGNCLSDLLSQMYFSLPYDYEGKKAAKGFYKRKIERWLDNFFEGKLPCLRNFDQKKAFCLSTQDFHLISLAKALKKTQFCPYDILLTSHYYVSRRILQCLPLSLFSKIEVFGGGAFNQTGVKVLSELIYPMNVVKSCYHPQVIESLGFSWLGHQRVNGIYHKKSFTGAKKDLLVGCIIYPGDTYYPCTEVKIKELEKITARVDFN